MNYSLNGVNVESTKELSHGKFNNGMAKYLWERVMLDGNNGDDEVTTGDDAGVARYGRRLLAWDNCGFVNCETFATIELAKEAMPRLCDYSNDAFFSCENVSIYACKCGCGNRYCVEHCWQAEQHETQGRLFVDEG